MQRPFGGVFVVFLFHRMHYAPGLVLLSLSFLQGFNTLPWRSAHSEAFAFLAVLAWIWGVARRNAAVQISLNTPVIALLCAALLVGIQSAWGQIAFGGEAAVLFIYMGLCISTLFIAQWHGDDANWPRVLAFALLAAALISALIALVQALGVWGGIDGILRSPAFRRPGANLGQPNHLGTLLIMGAASLIYLDQRLRISRLLTMILSLLLLVGMGITESRTGLLSGIFLCAWWFSQRRLFIHAPRWQWVAASAAALFTIMWAWPPLITCIQEAGPLQTKVMISTTSSLRMEVWQQLWEAMWLKPWLGWGLRGVSTALNAVLHNYPVSAPFTYAHNIVLDMAIGMGLPLTLLATYGAGVWIWRRIKNIRTVEAWFAAGLLIPFGIHSMLEYPFAYAYFLVPAMLAVGILEKNAAPRAGMIVSRRIVLGTLVLSGALLTWTGLEYLKIEEDFRVARFESLNVGKTPDRYEQPDIFLFTQLKAMTVAARTTPRPDMPAEEIENLRTVTLKFPWLPFQSSYALSLALNGSPEEAIRQLKVMRSMHGEKSYQGIKAYWMELAKTKHPQLEALTLP